MSDYVWNEYDARWRLLGSPIDQYGLQRDIEEEVARQPEPEPPSDLARLLQSVPPEHAPVAAIALGFFKDAVAAQNQHEGRIKELSEETGETDRATLEAELAESDADAEELEAALDEQEEINLYELGSEPTEDDEAEYARWVEEWNAE